MEESDKHFKYFSIKPFAGLPDINIDDLKANTEYHKYTTTSLQIVWFWRALRSCDQTDRAKLLQFVTGSSKVPLQVSLIFKSQYLI